MDWVKIFDLAPGKEVYKYLKSTSVEEREILCRSAEFSDMCRLIDQETRTKLTGVEFTRYGHNSLGNVLESFDDFDTAMDFIKSVRPGFVYSDAFKEFVDSYIVYKNESRPRGDILTYTLGSKYEYKEENGDIYTKLDGELHSFGDRPSTLLFTTKNILQELLWHKNGVRYRDDDKPARIEYYPNTNFVQFKTWYLNGVGGRIGDKPVKIEYYKPINGQSYVKIEYFTGHNDGLANIKYYKPDENGVQQKFQQVWFPRLNKITSIEYDKNGKPKRIEYLDREYRKHRTDGPAVIQFLKGGDESATREEFWIRGRLQEEFEDAEEEAQDSSED